MERAEVSAVRVFIGPPEWVIQSTRVALNQQETIASLRQLADSLEEDIADWRRDYAVLDKQNARLEARCNVLWYALVAMFFIAVIAAGLYLDTK